MFYSFHADSSICKENGFQIAFQKLSRLFGQGKFIKREIMMIERSIALLYLGN